MSVCICVVLFFVLKKGKQMKTSNTAKVKHKNKKKNVMKNKDKKTTGRKNSEIAGEQKAASQTADKKKRKGHNYHDEGKHTQKIENDNENKTKKIDSQLGVILSKTDLKSDPKARRARKRKISHKENAGAMVEVKKVKYIDGRGAAKSGESNIGAKGISENAPEVKKRKKKENTGKGELKAKNVKDNITGSNVNGDVGQMEGTARKRRRNRKKKPSSKRNKYKHLDEARRAARLHDGRKAGEDGILVKSGGEAGQVKMKGNEGVRLVERKGTKGESGGNAKSKRKRKRKLDVQKSGGEVRENDGDKGNESFSQKKRKRENSDNDKMENVSKKKKRKRKKKENTEGLKRDDCKENKQDSQNSRKRENCDNDKMVSTENVSKKKKRKRKKKENTEEMKQHYNKENKQHSQNAKKKDNIDNDKAETEENLSKKKKRKRKKKGSSEKGNSAMIDSECSTERQNKGENEDNVAVTRIESKNKRRKLKKMERIINKMEHSHDRHVKKRRRLEMLKDSGDGVIESTNFIDMENGSVSEKKKMKLDKTGKMDAKENTSCMMEGGDNLSVVKKVKQKKKKVKNKENGEVKQALFSKKGNVKRKTSAFNLEKLNSILQNDLGNRNKSGNSGHIKERNDGDIPVESVRVKTGDKGTGNKMTKISKTKSDKKISDFTMITENENKKNKLLKKGKMQIPVIDNESEIKMVKPETGHKSNDIDKANAKKMTHKEELMNQLKSARFRYLNQQMYTQTGSAAMDMFADDREAFMVYHEGFQTQVAKWPTNPVDIIIQQLQKRYDTLIKK